MSRARAILLVLLLAPWAGLAASQEAPAPTTWSPYAAPTLVDALAVSANGSVIATGLEPPNSACVPAPPIGSAPTLPGGTTSVTARGDLDVLTFENGFARTTPASDETHIPFGRSMVAVSRDGTTILSIGQDTQGNTVGAGGQCSAPTLTPRLYYNRIRPQDSWAVPVPGNFNTSLELSGTPVGIALSEDGRRAALALNGASWFHVVGYNLRDLADGTVEFREVFRKNQSNAQASAIAASQDLGRVLVAGHLLQENNQTHALLNAYLFSTGQVQREYRDPSAQTSLLSLATTASADRAFAGGLDGLLYAFPEGNQGPVRFSLGAGNVTNVTTNADGARVAAVAGDVLAHLDTRTPLPVPLWNLTIPGPVHGMQYNRTGTVLAVAYAGGYGAAAAYGDSSPTPLWSYAGDARGVAINDAATRFTYAHRQNVHALAVPRNITLEFPGGGDTGPGRVVATGTPAIYDLNLRNTGSVPERVRLETSTSLDVRFEADPATLLLEPGETKRITVNLTPGASFTGTRSIRVDAVALGSAARSNATLDLTLATSANVSLFLDETEVILGPAEEHILLLGIRNTGTKDAAIGLRALQSAPPGQAWDVSIERESLTVAPTSVTTVRVRVTPGQDVPDGTTNAITFLLEGQDLGDQARVVYRINPRVDLDINAFGKVKFVEPGRTAFFNVTVVNTGSLPRQFEVFHALALESAQTWAVDLAPHEPFHLDAGQVRNVTVRVIAPATAQPQERLVITLTARSLPDAENETVVTKNVTLFANAVAPQPVSPTGKDGSLIPAPAPALLLAGLGLAAVALRRRRAP